MGAVFRGLAVALCLLAWPRVADADWAKETFAHFVGKDYKILEVKEIDVGGRGNFTHVLVGLTEYKNQKIARTVLLRCNRKACHGTNVFHGPTDELWLGVVDLENAAARDISKRKPLDHASKLEANSLEWPALVIETRESKTETTASRFGGEVTGTRKERELSVISLRRRDKKRPRLFRARSWYISATGAGWTNSYKLLGKKGKVVEIEEKNQRYPESRAACIKPDPTFERYQLSKGQFVRVTKKPGKAGC